MARLSVAPPRRRGRCRRASVSASLPRCQGSLRGAAQRRSYPGSEVRLELTYSATTVKLDPSAYDASRGLILRASARASLTGSFASRGRRSCGHSSSARVLLPDSGAPSRRRSGGFTITSCSIYIGFDLSAGAVVTVERWWTGTATNVQSGVSSPRDPAEWMIVRCFRLGESHGMSLRPLGCQLWLSHVNAAGGSSRTIPGNGGLCSGPQRAFCCGVGSTVRPRPAD